MVMEMIKIPEYLYWKQGVSDFIGCLCLIFS